MRYNKNSYTNIKILINYIYEYYNKLHILKYYSYIIPTYFIK